MHKQKGEVKGVEVEGSGEVDVTSPLVSAYLFAILINQETRTAAVANHRMMYYQHRQRELATAFHKP